MKHSKKVVAALGAGAIAVLATGVAYAYYTAGITGSSVAGATQSSTGASNVTVSLSSAASNLVPGSSAKSLVVTLTNNNAYYVNVTGKTLTLDFAHMTSSVGATCTPASGHGNDVALLSASPQSAPTASIAGSGGTATVTFNDVAEDNSATVDQTPCVGATYTIPVVIS